MPKSSSVSPAPLQPHPPLSPIAPWGAEGPALQSKAIPLRSKKTKPKRLTNLVNEFDHPIVRRCPRTMKGNESITKKLVQLIDIMRECWPERQAFLSNGSRITAGNAMTRRYMVAKGLSGCKDILHAETNFGRVRLSQTYSTTASVECVEEVALAMGICTMDVNRKINGGQKLEIDTTEMRADMGDEIRRCGAEDQELFEACKVLDQEKFTPDELVIIRSVAASAKSQHMRLEKALKYQRTLTSLRSLYTRVSTNGGNFPRHFTYNGVDMNWCNKAINRSMQYSVRLYLQELDDKDQGCRVRDFKARILEFNRTEANKYKYVSRLDSYELDSRISPEEHYP